MSLLEARKTYKPFEYPWAYEFWKRQQQVHWMPEEVPLGEDVKDWASKLNDQERNLLTQIFRFFTQLLLVLDQLPVFGLTGAQVLSQSLSKSSYLFHRNVIQIAI